ncbi:MAG: DUF4859 domain-containing protein [Prevotella sp.]|nr:DUF4859 domain-containing protein [Prevotella sp.]
MRKITLTTLTLFVTLLHVGAQKTVYIPNEWRQARTDTLLYAESDPDNKYTWSKSRSKETDNVIVFWDKYYGKTSPSEVSGFYNVDIDDLLRKCEAFFDLEINQLGFVDPNNSNLNKYKVMVLMNHTDTWTCYGGGYDYQVSALWLNPATCKPVGHSVAHEIGHSFHYMCYSEASKQGSLWNVQTGFHGAVGNGSVTWEQTAQWQANQSYPELMYDQSIGVFRNSHNYAFTHEWHRYQSYWFFYYLCQYYNDIKTVANVWNWPETSVKDFNQVLMDYKGLSVDELYKMYFDYACRLVTWDLEVCKPYRNPYIGDFTYRCALTEDGSYQVALASAPQSTGFNVIPLNVPDAGTEVTTHFTALRYDAKLANGDPGEYLDGNSVFSKANVDNYQVINGSYRGFRLGYVALLKDGTRQYFSQDSIYCTGGEETTVTLSFTVPDNTDRMWLVVSPALKRYIQHKWDEKFAADDRWPYRVSFEGTDIGGNATVYASPTLDKRSVADITFDFHVVLPADKSNFRSTTVNLGGRAAAMLGTAFQCELSRIGSALQAYSVNGPGNGKMMFYPLNPTDYSLAESGSTANGYGHWFNQDGMVCGWNANNSYVFSEFNSSSLAFTIGQNPGKCHVGDSYTIGQAIVYKQNFRQSATARFIFHVTIGEENGAAQSYLASIDYDDPTGIQWVNASSSITSNSDVYTLTGTKVVNSSTLPKGIYIQGGKKVYVK